MASGALGLGAAWRLAGLPPGRFAGEPAELARATFVQPGASYWVLTLALGTLVAWAGTRTLARWRDLGDPTALRALRPVGIGATLPLAALALDPWSTASTAPPLTAAGLAIGAMWTAARLRPADKAPPPGPGRTARGRRTDRRVEGAGAITRPAALLALGAVALPILLVAPGPPWWHPISGDEPHYLVLAQSLVEDGDVDVSDDYADGSHRRFFPADLSPHALPGSDPARLHSIHGVGLAVWLAPWFVAARGLRPEAFGVVIRSSMALWLGAAALILHLLIRDLAGAGAANRGVAATVFAVPLLFAGTHAFPDVPALVLSAAAWWLLREPGAWPRSGGRALAAGLLLACLPWLHFKYALLAVAVAAGGVWTIRRGADGLAPRQKGTALTALLAPLALTALGHLAFTWSLYGRLSPMAIQVGTLEAEPVPGHPDELGAYLADPWGIVRAAVGFFLDQREGLLFYAPVYLLAAAGLAWLWQRRRLDAAVLVAALAALTGPYAVSQTIGAWAPPARPLTGVLWTLAVPAGVALVLPVAAGAVAPWKARLRGALRGFLLAWTAGATLILVVQSDLLYHDYGVTRSLVLQRYGAPGLPLPDLAPLWLVREESVGIVSWLWLGAALAAAAVLWGWGRDAAGDRLGGTDSGAGPGRPEAGTTGRVAASCLFGLGAAALVAHHAVVPVSLLHVPHGYEEATIWIPESPPQRLWPGGRGVTVGGFGDERALLSTARPAAAVVVEVAAFAPMEITVQLGNDVASARLAADETVRMPLRPGPGHPWRGARFHPIRVVTRGGTSPAALGDPSDDRTVGVYLAVVEVRTER